MGHEMGHYVAGPRGAYDRAVVGGHAAGLFLVDWVGAQAGRALCAIAWALTGFRTWPRCRCVLMLLEVAIFVLSPVALAYSRHQEHEADKFALDMTHDNHSGARAFVKTAQENLSNPRPGPIFKFFRSSHPSIGERIDFCNSYRPVLSSADRRPFRKARGRAGELNKRPNKNNQASRRFDMARPESNEYAAYYEKYISLVPEERNRDGDAIELRGPSFRFSRRSRKVRRRFAIRLTPGQSNKSSVI